MLPLSVAQAYGSRPTEDYTSNTNNRVGFINFYFSSQNTLRIPLSVESPIAYADEVEMILPYNSES